jgi:hypothetical protein
MGAAYHRRLRKAAVRRFYRPRPISSCDELWHLRQSSSKGAALMYCAVSATVFVIGKLFELDGNGEQTFALAAECLLRDFPVEERELAAFFWFHRL